MMMKNPHLIVIKELVFPYSKIPSSTNDLFIQYSGRPISQKVANSRF